MKDATERGQGRRGPEGTPSLAIVNIVVCGGRAGFMLLLDVKCALLLYSSMGRYVYIDLPRQGSR